MKVNEALSRLIEGDLTSSSDVNAQIDGDGLDRMVASIRLYEKGLYIYDIPEFGPGKFARYSESKMFDNGGATSFRLHRFVSKIDVILPRTALEMSRRLSEGTFAGLKRSGIAEASSIMCLAYDEPGEEEWDFRFIVGAGSQRAAIELLNTNQPTAVSDFLISRGDGVSGTPSSPKRNASV